MFELQVFGVRIFNIFTYVVAFFTVEDVDVFKVLALFKGDAANTRELQ